MFYVYYLTIEYAKLLYANLDPIIFYTKYINIHWYGFIHIILYILNTVFLYSFISKKDETIHRDNTINLLIIISIGLLLGGKLGFLSLYQPNMIYFDKLSFIKLWLPGRSFYGGLIGTLLIFYIYVCNRPKRNCTLHNYIIILIPIDIFLVRFGNFMNGELYGKVTENCLGIIYPHIDNNCRHSSQLYEAFSEGLFLLFILIVIKKIRPRDSCFISYFILLYSTIRFMAEHFRSIDIFILNYFFKYSFTLAQIISIVAIITTLLTLIKANNETIFKFIKRYIKEG